MKTIDQWLEEYGESHRNKTNKLIHWICVPTIMFTVLGLLTTIPHGQVFSFMPKEAAFVANWGGVILVLAALFYLRLSFAMFLGMSLSALAMLYGAFELGKVVTLWQVCLVLFVVAWIFQFIGHKIEGKKPSFFKDVQFLLIGPAWLLSFIYRKLGIKYS